MITAWRIVKAKFTHSAFEGEGARRYGGRWNSPGRPAVYLGGSPAIAALEVLAHNARPALLASSFVIIEVNIPESCVLDLSPSALPPGWNSLHDTTASAAIGDAWLASGASLALRVPSAVLPLEHNLLLNAIHSDFKKLTVAEPQPFAFDPRLITAAH